MDSQSPYKLIKEMFQTVDVIKNFSHSHEKLSQSLKSKGKLFLTGEGSSRIFPAKNLIASALRKNSPYTIYTEGARQAVEYKLDQYTVVGASNSGRTRELVELFQALNNDNHPDLFALTANTNTPIEAQSRATYLLKCGQEDAVAATKSVVEQALFYHSLVEPLQGEMKTLSEKAREVLETSISSKIIEKTAKAHTLYFAGRNDGVAEELALKTNEITRKRSGYLEGTYAVHGVEEVMTADDVVVIISPFPSEQEKLQKTLVDPIGMTVIAIHSEDTLFPTLRIPSMGDFDSYLQLMTGWNLLASIGLATNINLDKPERARKIGNEI